MKKTMKYFSMAALALVGAVMTSCSNSSDFEETLTQPQPASGDKVETLTASVSMAGGETRALTDDGVKTFAVRDKIAVVYKNTSGETVKAESEELEAGDITNEGKSANFTVTLTNADKTQNVTYIYPAAMANSDGTINYNALAEQDGTLATLASDLDYCEYSGAWSGSNLPTGDMSNQLVVCAYTLKNSDGSDDITSNVTTMTVSDGTNVYIVNRTAAAGPIYVAIQPTDNKNIKYTAIASSKVYTKNVTGKTYTNGKWYPLGLRMTQNDDIIPHLFSVNGKKIYFSKGNLRAECASADNDGSTQETWTWRFSTNQYDRIGGLKSGESGTKSGNNNINGNGSINPAGNVDLFGWSTSATHLGINVTNSNNTAYLGAFADWGSASEVTACIGTGWRTPTSNEWRYLTVTRSGNRFAMAKLWNNRCGMILLPDDWNTGYYSLNNINDASVDFSVNTISSDDWTNKLARGAVFLPVTGQRNGSNWINGANDQLHYWSSTKGDTDSGTSANANHMRWMPNTTTPEANRGLAPDTGAGRCNGYAVRLVYDIK